MANTSLVPFDEWECQRINLPDVNIFFRYAGTGTPILLIHGVPQHSLNFHALGPLLAQNHTVIVPDLPGMGQSGLPHSKEFTSERAATAVKGILDFLTISKVYIYSFDKGSAIGVLLAWRFPSLVEKLCVSEFALPSFGYEIVQNPSPQMGLFGNWHLALFTVPEAAEFLLRGREEEFLLWYFWHGSYSGTAKISTEHVKRYAQSLGKPGFLHAMTQFLGGSVWKDMECFKPLKEEPVEAPMMVLWGEGSMRPEQLSRKLWDGVGKSVEHGYVPKAGHWIPDENPAWLANHLESWYAANGSKIPKVNFSWLKDEITMM